jgi:hypothetical protein
MCPAHPHAGYSPRAQPRPEARYHRQACAQSRRPARSQHLRKSVLHRSSTPLSQEARRQGLASCSMHLLLLFFLTLKEKLSEESRSHQHEWLLADPDPALTLRPRLTDEVERRLRSPPEVTETACDDDLAYAILPGLGAQSQSQLLILGRRYADCCGGRLEDSTHRV